MTRNQTDAYLYRDDETGQVDTQGQTEQLEEVAMDRYQLGWEDVDDAVEEYLTNRGRLYHLKRVFLG